MAGVQERRVLAYSAVQMFDLVADVGRYAEFLPWVAATRVRSDDGKEMIADMLVGFKNLREKFTSRVEMVRPERVQVHYVDGPMRDLDNVWLFRPINEQSCEVEFLVSFSFRNALFEKLAGQYVDRAFRKMVAAFEARAEAIYGSNNSSAISAA